MSNTTEERHSSENRYEVSRKTTTKVVVITGASAGIGRAAVRQFTNPGVCIGLIARDEEGLVKAKEEVERGGGHARIFQIDVSDAEAMDNAAQQMEAEFGPIDVWVNDAMVSVFSPIKEMTPQEFARVTEVTYLGYVYGTMAALKRMLPRDRGTIVQVSSALAHRAIPLQSAYCGSKHAIKGFTESLRCELAHDKSNVKVSMVAMPAVNTPQFDWVKSRLPNHPQPVPTIYQPEVAARAIVWAAEHAPRELLVGLPTVEAVWGEKFIPGLLDKYLGWTGYKSQQTNKPVSPDRPDNLMEPVGKDFGSHGDFDNRAKGYSITLWLQMNRKLVLSAIGILLLLTSVGAAKKYGKSQF